MARRKELGDEGAYIGWGRGEGEDTRGLRINGEKTSGTGNKWKGTWGSEDEYEKTRVGTTY
jgi:hypothetical protein